jgi:hypothetical protein
LANTAALTWKAIVMRHASGSSGGSCQVDD